MLSVAFSGDAEVPGGLELYRTRRVAVLVLTPTTTEGLGPPSGCSSVPSCHLPNTALHEVQISIPLQTIGLARLDILGLSSTMDPYPQLSWSLASTAADCTHHAIGSLQSNTIILPEPESLTSPP